ncbi:DUF2268 domain-containing protein [Falsibacillus albus]|uniref:DUF2268 domain-containing protein n=1 Tax=Falsibacillus albus TaxID=2478915 RepID=A0A3L7K305_9BACI|nr:DUF2268 domain-containing putative Zn-dependent protease [Falsibacillus albus]RLQ97200.1 hypothetical protein D9X91_03350 [Falsibacillus albus]
MGVLQTDKWLDDQFFEPTAILKKIDENLNKEQAFYKYLKQFGMYQPNRRTKETFEQLKEANAWKKIDRYYKKYKKFWNGPAVKIAIFPIDTGNRRLMRQTRGRAGITFHEIMYLFLSPQDDEKEWESLFIHEYHHAVRLNHFKKEMTEYTLLDSLLLEGLAEHAVLECCGEKYLGPWCDAIEEPQLDSYWEKWFSSKLDVKKKEAIHDDLLFGKRNLPNLLGYSMGFYIVKVYKKKHDISTVSMIDLPPKKLLLKKFFTKE